MLALKKHNITYLYNQQEHWLITVVYKKIFTKNIFGTLYAPIAIL